MQRITTNVKAYRPHIKWILKKLRLKTYDVRVMFLSRTEARRQLFPIGKTGKEYASFRGMPYGPTKIFTGIIWINSTLIRHYHPSPLTPISVLAHELRHYYQGKTKKFPLSRKEKDFLYKMAIAPVVTMEMAREYENTPRERDARQFQMWIEKQFELETSSKKCKLKMWL